MGMRLRQHPSRLSTVAAAALTVSTCVAVSGGAAGAATSPVTSTMTSTVTGGSGHPGRSPHDRDSGAGDGPGVLDGHAHGERDTGRAGQAGTRQR